MIGFYRTVNSLLSSPLGGYCFQALGAYRRGEAQKKNMRKFLLVDSFLLIYFRHYSNFGRGLMERGV